MKYSIHNSLKFLVLITTTFGFVVSVHAQQLQYEFTFDDAGNRVKREVIYLSYKKDPSENSATTSENVNAMSTDSEEGILAENVSDGYDFLVFPNPTISTVTLQITKEFQKGNVQLSSSSGRIIFRSTNLMSNTEIDLSQEPAGHYILKLNLDDKSVKQWLIVKEK